MGNDGRNWFDAQKFCVEQDADGSGWVPAFWTTSAEAASAAQAIEDTNTGVNNIWLSYNIRCESGISGSQTSFFRGVQHGNLDCTGGTLTSWCNAGDFIQNYGFELIESGVASWATSELGGECALWKSGNGNFRRIKTTNCYDSGFNEYVLCMTADPFMSAERGNSHTTLRQEFENSDVTWFNTQNDWFTPGCLATRGRRLQSANESNGYNTVVASNSTSIVATPPSS